MEIQLGIHKYSTHERDYRKTETTYDCNFLFLYLIYKIIIWLLIRCLYLNFFTYFHKNFDNIQSKYNFFKNFEN